MSQPPSMPPQGAPFGQNPYTTHPAGTPAGPRPGVLTASLWLHVAAAAVLAVGYVLLSVLQFDMIVEELRTDPDLRDAFGDDVEGVAATILAIGGVVLLLVLALWVALAALTARGRQWARITLTVVGVLGATCMLCGAIGTVFEADVAALLVYLLVAGLGIAGLVLMWLPASSRWIGRRRAERG